MHTFTKQLAAAALVLGFVAAAGAWQGPAQEPPAGNVAAPVNVSAAAQSKQGTLGVGNLGVFGKAFVSPVAGYALPGNLLLGVNGAVGASAYCDAQGQNCVTTLGGAAAGGAASSPATSGWVDVPLWGVTPFKPLCEYRWHIGGSVYTPSIVSAGQLFWMLSNDSQIYLPYNDKSRMYITPYGPADAWGLVLSKLEERC